MATVSTLAIDTACSESWSIGASPAAVVADAAGISGISQIGQLPGWSSRTCGCIEHV
jgi:hypothetical protein